MLTLRRARRPFAIVCIAVIALAAFAPGVAALDLSPPPPEFVLLPLLEPLDRVPSIPVSAEQPEAFRAALPKRAPPAFVVAGL